MPVETFQYLDSLVASNPVSSEGLVSGDDHIRGLKFSLQATFPGVNAAATRVIGTGFGVITGPGTASAPSYSFIAEPTLGFYRSAAGVITVAGGKLKGALPVGALHMFLVEPAGLGKAATGTGHDYLELDGSTWPNSAFPDLATHLGQGGTTFTLPDAKTLGRFPRSRTATVAAGTAQASQNKAHTHTGSGLTASENADHTHSFSGTTGADSPDHSHGLTGAIGNSSTGGGSFACGGSVGAVQTGGASARHTHSFGGTTGGINAVHQHAFSFTTSGGSADGTEARPEALSFVFCIKT